MAKPVYFDLFPFHIKATESVLFGGGLGRTAGRLPPEFSFVLGLIRSWHQMEAGKAIRGSLALFLSARHLHLKLGW